MSTAAGATAKSRVNSKDIVALFAPMVPTPIALLVPAGSRFYNFGVAVCVGLALFGINCMLLARERRERGVAVGTMLAAVSVVGALQSGLHVVMGPSALLSPYSEALEWLSMAMWAVFIVVMMRTLLRARARRRALRIGADA